MLSFHSSFLYNMYCTGHPCRSTVRSPQNLFLILFFYIFGGFFSSPSPFFSLNSMCWAENQPRICHVADWPNYSILTPLSYASTYCNT